MIFGEVPLAEAEGAILAHSHALEGLRLRKGRPLSAADVAALAAAGLDRVIVARPEAGDLGEDEAAARLAEIVAETTAGLDPAPAGSGRAALRVATRGLLRVDAAALAAVNGVTETVTLATPPDFTFLDKGSNAAAVKIIPFFAPSAAIERATTLLRESPPLRLHPAVLLTASLIVTATPGLKPALLDKGLAALRDRAAAVGLTVVTEARVPHETAALAAALAEAPGDVVLVVTGAATSCRRDVGPSALEAAGGGVERVGSPVDPGNLCFLGDLRGRPVLGLPGSTRSPRRSFGDLMLERLVCGVSVTGEDVAALAAGGLLAAERPRSRSRPLAQPPLRVSALLLAAGRSTRMRGRDKLMETVDGRPLLRRSAEALIASGATETVVVLGPEDEDRREALARLPLRRVVNPRPEAGLAASLRAGLDAIDPEADALIVALADMPELGAAHVDALIDAFAPDEGRAICRAATEAGRPGHPVLFARAFFDDLAALEGDVGARDLLAAHADRVAVVPTPGEAAVIDLDTPEAWNAWRAGR